jgi:hypothetical protein
MKKNALICLAILINYRKYENMKQNIYVEQMRNIQKPSTFLALNNVITQYLYNWALVFEKTLEKSSFVNYIYNWFSNTSSIDKNIKPKDIKQVGSMLLIFYELVHINNDFVGALTRSLASIAANEDNLKRLEKKTSSNLIDRLDEREQSSANIKGCPLILREFLRLCSILFQEPHYIQNYVLKTDSSKTDNTVVDVITASNPDISTQYYAQLCLIIIFCLLDKRIFCSFLFDLNTKLDFTLFTKEKGQFVLKEYREQSGSLAQILLELLLQFLNHYMGRHHFSMDLYSKALTVTHSMLCLAKRYRVRFSIDWKLLWQSLIRICDIISDGHCNRDKLQACQILSQVLTIFNFGILKGDLFFPSRRDQEEMIYQLVHQRHVFEKLGDWMERNLKKKNPVMCLRQNIELIISDVVTSLDMEFHNSSYPSESDVLNIIKKSMSEFKIVKIDGLEKREEYIEEVNEIQTFFNRMTRLFVHEIRTGAVLNLIAYNGN